MDKTALVGFDVETGAEVIRALDDTRIRISVGLWLFASEYNDWRLVLSSRRLDSVAPAAGYGLVREALAGAGFTLERTPPLLILPMSDPFIRELRRVFRKAKTVEGMRLGGQLIGDKFVEDAYVYRIS